MATMHVGAGGIGSMLTNTTTTIITIELVEALKRRRDEWNLISLRQSAFVPQSRDYGVSKGFGGSGAAHDRVSS
jgi:hypothetical protein